MGQLDPADEILDVTTRTEALDEVKDHLLIAPPAVWMDVLLRCDWDDHHDLIRWIIAQPECDFGMAFMAFHLDTPSFYLRNNVTICLDDPFQAPICMTVLTQFAQGRFDQTETSVDPDLMASHIAALQTELGHTDPDTRPFDVPQAFLTPPQGPVTPLDPEWCPDTDSDIRDIYQAAGLFTGPGGMGADTPVVDAPPSTSIVLQTIAKLKEMARRPNAA